MLWRVIGGVLILLLLTSVSGKARSLSAEGVNGIRCAGKAIGGRVLSNRDRSPILALHNDKFLQVGSIDAANVDFPLNIFSHARVNRKGYWQVEIAGRCAWIADREVKTDKAARLNAGKTAPITPSRFMMPENQTDEADAVSPAAVGSLCLGESRDKKCWGRSDDGETLSEFAAREGIAVETWLALDLSGLNLAMSYQGGDPKNSVATLSGSDVGGVFSQSTSIEGANIAQSYTMDALPVCEKNLGTIALVDGDGRGWAAANLGAPSELLKAVVSESKCFTLVNHGAELSTLVGESALAPGGKLQQDSNMGAGRVKAADYVLVADIGNTDANAGGSGVAGTVIGGRVGGLLGGIKTKRVEAQTVLTLMNVRTSEIQATAEGSASKKDIGFAAGAGYGFGGTVGRGYEDTEVGKVVTYAFLDAYRQIVGDLGGLPAEAAGKAQTEAFKVSAKSAKLKRSPSPSSRAVRSLEIGEMVYPTGKEEDLWWEVEDENGNAGWVESQDIRPASTIQIAGRHGTTQTVEEASLLRELLALSNEDDRELIATAAVAALGETPQRLSSVTLSNGLKVKFEMLSPDSGHFVTARTYIGPNLVEPDVLSVTSSVVRPTANVKLREGPGLDYSVLSIFPRGHSGQKLGFSGDKKWTLVESDSGVIGYVFTELLAEEQQDRSKLDDRAECKTLRITIANLESISNLCRGTKVE